MEADQQGTRVDGCKAKKSGLVFWFSKKPAGMQGLNKNLWDFLNTESRTWVSGRVVDVEVLR